MMTASNLERDVRESQDEAFNWRVAQYGEMGFDPEESLLLARAKQISITGGKTRNEKKLEWQTPLDWKKVKAALDAGCDRKTALEIFT